MKVINGGIKVRFSRRENRNFLEIFLVGIKIHKRKLKETEKTIPSLNQILQVIQKLDIGELIFDLIKKLFKAVHLKDVKVSIGKADSGGDAFKGYIYVKAEVAHYMLIIPLLRLFRKKSFSSLIKNLNANRK